LKQYYSNRAEEYEKVYYRDDPIRQKEQLQIANQMKKAFTNRSVLEVACGTGYWTKTLVEVANNVKAVDYSHEVLSIAKEKDLPSSIVTFCKGNAYKLDDIEGIFDGGCANFWFSHIPKVNISGFLDGLHRRLGTGSIVFMADNMYVEGIGGKLLKKESTEDTYKLRELSDGTRYEIIKNYFDKNELINIFESRAEDLKIHIGKCFWWIQYRVK
jgi:ubiquinone/menaquinone biosynthesis C-methylase UbiE